MVDISRKTYERNSIETIVDNDQILWLNEKHIQKGLDHKNLRKITTKHHLDHRKHRYEKCNRISIHEKLAIKYIMDCRTTAAHKFRTRLVFRQYDVILTEKQ